MLLLKAVYSGSGGGSSMRMGGLIAQLHTAFGSGTEVCSADESAQSAEIFFVFIFQLPGWALVAPSSLGDQSGQSFLLGPPCTLGLYGYCIVITRVLQYSLYRNNPFLTIQNNPFLS